MGGGLASIDVVKVLQIEMTLAGLKERGIGRRCCARARRYRAGAECDGLTYGDLGVAPCKFFYRRRVLDMPLSDIPAGTPAKRAESLRAARRFWTRRSANSYSSFMNYARRPDRQRRRLMVGVNFSRTEVVEGKADRAVNARPAPMTISSIGSIPEPIPGIAQKGEVYSYVDQKVGLVFEGRTAVFAAGNVLTGKGNIKDSLESGTEIGTR